MNNNNNISIIEKSDRRIILKILDSEITILVKNNKVVISSDKQMSIFPQASNCISLRIEDF